MTVSDFVLVLFDIFGSTFGILDITSLHNPPTPGSACGTKKTATSVANKRGGQVALPSQTGPGRARPSQECVE